MPKTNHLDPDAFYPPGLKADPNADQNTVPSALVIGFCTGANGARACGWGSGGPNRVGLVRLPARPCADPGL